MHGAVYAFWFRVISPKSKRNGMHKQFVVSVPSRSKIRFENPIAILPMPAWGILGIFRDQWGAWSYDAETNLVKFQKEEHSEAYMISFECALRGASDRQKRLLPGAR